ncbi:MAG: hypothetical protein AAFP70_04325 [Calditrichota bacterium]
MMKLLTMFLAVCLFTIYAFAQVPDGYKIGQGEPDRSGLIGNGVTDLAYKNGTIYAGTGFGLSISEDEGLTWQNFTAVDYGGQGGVSAIFITDDNTLWIATAYDTLVEEDQSLSIGGGLRYREAGSNDWVFIPQPVDAVTDTAGGQKPTTTRVQNITFDITVRGSDEVWITSFGGGVRRSLDRGQSWEVKTTDGKPFSALDELNHRGFSATIDTSGNVWIGTVDGISKTADGGVTWERYRHDNQSQPISADWAIGLWHNPWDNSIWSTTIRSVDTTETNGVSRTKNGGLTWDTYLTEELSDGTFARYVAFYDSALYVSTEKGVYKSIDDGNTWFLFPMITDNVSGESINTSVFYSAATSPAASPNHRLWVGSLDGMASTANNGFDWTVFRGFVSTRDADSPSVYAYPNPYSPQISDRPLRFQFDVESAGVVTIGIYNFAMERVIELTSSQGAPTQGSFDRSMVWDGNDSNGRPVDNGVYFFRAQVGSEVNWGKIMIVN